MVIGRGVKDDSGITEGVGFGETEGDNKGAIVGEVDSVVFIVDDVWKTLPEIITNHRKKITRIIRTKYNQFLDICYSTLSFHIIRF